MVSLTNGLAGAVGTETSGLVALQRLFDYQFSPRLANLGDARLWRIDRKADYGPFNSLSKGTINLALIRENWPFATSGRRAWVATTATSPISPR